jgi:nucleotidyltransferase/DNA polymerase involved in DNA repair
VDRFLLEQNVSALPGVGWSGARKLEVLGVKTIADVRACPAADLQRVLGAKSGEELVNYAYGRDNREVCFQRNRFEVLLLNKTRVPNNFNCPTTC